MQPHDTAYFRFKSRLTGSERERFYMPTEDELAFCAMAARLPTTRLGLGVLLKTFRRLGYFILSSLVPESLIRHIAQANRRNTYLRNLKHYDKSEARIKHVADIINVGIEVLIRHRDELHAFNSLVWAARTEAKFLPLHIEFGGKNECHLMLKAFSQR